MAKVQIRRVGVFSYAKIAAVVNAAFGLFIGVIYGLIVMAAGGAIMAGGGRGASGAGASAIVIGLVIMFAIPISSGIFGFIAGAIGGVTYNVVAGVVGGIEVELENTDGVGYAPPAPGWGDQPPYTPGQQQYPY